jgi:hypothetical protein
MYTTRKFSIPYTEGMIDALADLDTSTITDVYFSDNKFGSARSLFNGRKCLMNCMRSETSMELKFIIL